MHTFKAAIKNMEGDHAIQVLKIHHRWLLTFYLSSLNPAKT